ncbi:MAG TPA: hypothetical protein VIF83_14145 [Gemmatimonadaceae bacterium]
MAPGLTNGTSQFVSAAGENGTLDFLDTRHDFFGDPIWRDTDGFTIRVTPIDTVCGRVTTSASIVIPPGPTSCFPPPPSSNIQAVTTFDTGMAAAASFSKNAPNTDVFMRVSLGTVFNIGLQKPQGNLLPVIPITSSYTVGASTVLPLMMPISTATVMPTVIPLFPDECLLQVDNNSAAQRKQFIAVHLGTELVTIAPSSTSDAPRTFHIEVVPPTALGTTRNAFDAYIANVAHNTGIPPQYLKGQIRQEMFASHLREDNFRYEPCGADLKYVSGGVQLAQNDPMFIDFRLDTAVGVTLHPGATDELDPRSRYFIRRIDPTTRTTVVRRIADTDLAVTAREIWSQNNHVFLPPFPPGHVTSWNFDTGCSQTVLNMINAPNSTTLDFIAQTPTASSFGLMQVMWLEAKEIRFWNGVTVGALANSKQPKYLFDRTSYVNVGGGSVQIGANIDASHWRGGTTSQFPTLEDFDDRINQMMTRYNPAWRSGVMTYGDLVVNYADFYPPASPVVIFP